MYTERERERMQGALPSQIQFYQKKRRDDLFKGRIVDIYEMRLS
jgi:hypothetical protein